MGAKNEKPALRGVRVTGYRRLNNSVNGNPRFEIAFSDGTVARSQSDASISYDVENKARKDAPALDVYLTKAGRVSWWRPAESGEQS